MSTTDTTHEEVLQGVRDWLLAAGAIGGLTELQVLKANQKGPRPPLPYLTVRLLAVDLPVGVDQPISYTGDQITILTGVTGTAYTLTVNGEAISYIRLSTDTNTTVAAAIVALINANEDLTVYAANVAAVIWLAPTTGTLTTSTSNPKLTLLVDEVVVKAVLAQRRATVSVQAFGVAATAWLERAAARLDYDDVVTALDAAGLSIVAMGGMTDISALLDTSIEGRSLREFDVAYSIRTEPALAVPLETAEIDGTMDHYTGDADELAFSIDVEVS